MGCRRLLGRGEPGILLVEPKPGRFCADSQMSFDTLAPGYRISEWLLAGQLLQRARLAHLHKVFDCRQALLLGEGPGRFLIPLLQQAPDIKVTCVEQSPGMVRQLKLHLARSGLSRRHVEIVEADIFTWKPVPGSFDLVVACFFLDCFTPDQLEQLTARVGVAATSDARWLVADFNLPDTGWQGRRASILLWLMYRFFRWATALSASHLASPDPYLSQVGFIRRDQRLLSQGLIRSDLWQR
jgi:ubiquinone/menaquinone biosynthesis C-methylase UbiE